MISEAAVIEFNVNKKAVAKLYPQDGLDFVLLDKNYSIQTDNKTFLKVNSKSKETLFSCELKYE